MRQVEVRGAGPNVLLEEVDGEVEPNLLLGMTRRALSPETDIDLGEGIPAQ